VASGAVARWWAALVAALVAGCDLPGRPRPEDRPVPPDRVLKFTQLFKRNCAGCHGADGKVGPAPPLNDPLFRAIVPEEVVRDVITSGRPGTPMAAFASERGGALTPEQVKVLTYEIKGIRYKIRKTSEEDDARKEVVRDDEGDAPQWGAPGPAPQGVPSYLPPKDRQGPGQGPGQPGVKPEELRARPQAEPGPGEVDRGAKVFARACAGCHGQTGRGQAGEQGKSLVINNHAFLSLISDQALRRYAITGRSDLTQKMPDYRGDLGRGPHFKPLTSDEISDLVALLASWRHEGSVNGK
jgi:mono/diheme cytochrome c family protein